MTTQPHFNLCLRTVGHGHTPPLSALNIVLAWAKQEMVKTPAVFDPNPNFDLYSIVKSKTGAVTDLVRRVAIACEFLRILGDDESDFDWEEGRDTTAGAETPAQMEAGAFQVSFNSHLLGKDLMIFLIQNGITSAQQFQDRLKADPILDCAYTFRLLRQPYKRWDGPINLGWVLAQFQPDCVDEWVVMLTAA